MHITVDGHISNTTHVATNMVTKHGYKLYLAHVNVVLLRNIPKQSQKAHMFLVLYEISQELPAFLYFEEFLIYLFSSTTNKQHVP